MATKWIWSHPPNWVRFLLIKLIKCINYVIHENLDDFLVYVDDIFIFPRDFKGHNRYVWFILGKLKEIQLYTKNKWKS
jgi:hypothetical protein